MNQRKNHPKYVGFRSSLDLSQKDIKFISNQIVEYVEENEEVLFISQVCNYIKLSQRSLDNLSREHESINNAFEYVKSILESRLTLGAIHDRLNMPFSKFVLSAKLGYSEKTTQQIEFNEIKKYLCALFYKALYEKDPSWTHTYINNLIL